MPPPTDDAELVVAAGIDLVLLSRDELLVQYGTRFRPSELFRDDELTGLLGTLVDSLRSGPVRVMSLVAAVAPQLREEARRVVADLVERGFLTDVGRDLVTQYLAYTFEGSRDAGEQPVTVIGAGPLGARIASSLASHPVGRIELLAERAPGVDAIRSAVDGTALTVVALERTDLRLAHLVNRVCLELRRPWLHAGMDGNRGLIGPLFVPPYTACFNDYWTLVAATTPSPAMANAYRRRTSSREDNDLPSGPPVFADIVAGHAVLAVLHFLLRDTSFAVGRQVVVDFDSLRIDVEDVLKLPRCPVCGTDRPSRRPVIASEIVAQRPAPAHAR
jgi:bacteriocin biosynthesis cyclodehydratase domain-containing protein